MAASGSQYPHYQQSPVPQLYEQGPPFSGDSASTGTGNQVGVAYPNNVGGNFMPYGDVVTAAAKVPWNPSQASSYNGIDIANEDVDENVQEENVTPSAPSYDTVIPGYENLASGSVGPPPPYDSIKMVPAMVDSSRVPNITDEDARDALLGFVNKNCCWGSAPAKEMSIRDLVATNAYHYVLETYTEGRKTHNTHVPYVGGYVDGPHNGPAPMPWDMPCHPTSLFKSEEHKIPVPHTEVVRPCHTCFGRGFNRCGKCKGRGKVMCSSCHGSGRKRVTNTNGGSHHEPCLFCNGRGRKKCNSCTGHGCVVCSTCGGYGSVKQFIQLTVTFTNRKDDHIVERSDLPNELIRNVQGDTIFEQELPRVWPIQNYFEQEINQRSKLMVDAHATAWPTERIIRQRHFLRSVPVHECIFQFKDKPVRFWIYGHQREVYTKDYPHTCCCCSCTIL